MEDNAGKKPWKTIFEPKRDNVGTWMNVGSQNMIYDLGGSHIPWSKCIELMEGPLSEHLSASGNMGQEEALEHVRKHRDVFDAVIHEGLDVVLKDYAFVSDVAGNVVKMKVY